MQSLSIDQVKAKLERFRKSTRGKRSWMPEELKEMVLALRGDHEDAVICERLQIHREYLGRWERKRATLNKTPKQNAKKKRKKNVSKKKPDFIDFTQAMAGPALVTSLTFEWQRADGSRLKVSGVLDSQIDRLTDRFLMGLPGDQR